MSPFIEIGKYLDIVDFCNLRLVNIEAAHYLVIKEKLKEYNFYLISKQSRYYKNIINYITSINGLNNIIINCTNTSINITSQNNIFCCKIPSDSFNSYIIHKPISLKVNLLNIQSITNYIENYDSLYIYQKKYNPHLIYIIIKNTFGKQKTISISF